ncbi:Transcriptional regulatory protein moc3, partial [Apiospora marii]|uniref:Transcriptional regulatory protein moc3 n=1 Tax=Apiospora marii TaxID=335849 RepID=UPI0031306883
SWSTPSRARKVKCDEARPACSRCRKSGRDCGGYEVPPTGSISWSRLLASGNTRAEARSLDLFRCIAARVFSGPTTNPLWTRPLLQLTMQEGPARDAILAISLLPVVPFAREKQRVAAVVYYNRALRHVATNCLDTEMVIYLSILFTCVEFLRYNAPAAIQHCRHAVQILQGSDDRLPPSLPAIIRHLATFPFFFGATLSDFPPFPHEDLYGHEY